MNRLLNIFHALRPRFEGDGPLGKLEPVFAAAEGLLFAPGDRTGASPHIRDPLDVKRYMALVILALLPCLAAAVYFFGLRVLAMVAASYVAGGTVEVAIAIIRGDEINEGFLVTGLIFPLILPPALPLWMVAVGSAFGVLVGKELFGGTGRNLFNPAMVGRCFLALSYPAAMSSGWIRPGHNLAGRLTQYVDASCVDALSSATPLGAAKHGELAPWLDVVAGAVPGCAGETSAVAVTLGGAFLLLVGISNWRTVVATLGSFAALNTVLHLSLPGSFGPTLWQLVAGGFLFGAFFMATDPVTAPTTNLGKWVYGTLIGSLTVLIRGLTGYVEGVMFAILLGNTCAPLIDDVAIRLRLRRLRDER